MTQEQLIEAAKELIAIPSTSDNPEARQAACEYIVNILENSGKDITIERFEQNGKQSILAYRGGQRPEKFRLILNGHVDVVPGKTEQYQAYIQDGKLYGRGTYDMKTAALVLADVFCEFVEKVPYALGLQIVTDEEGSGHNGTRYQIEQGVRADFVICGEGGRTVGTYEIANEAKGTSLITLEFHGNSAHGAYPWKGENAALKAANFVNRLNERYPTPPGETKETTITLTSIITTNDAHNKVPAYAVATIDARYAAGDPNFRSREHFTALIKEIDPHATIKEFILFDSPSYANPHNPILLNLKTAAEKVEGKPFDLVRRNGASDARFYGDVGNEACEFGIAGEHHHADGEYVPLQACFDYHATMREFLQMSISSEHPIEK